MGKFIDIADNNRVVEINSTEELIKGLSEGKYGFKKGTRVNAIDKQTGEMVNLPAEQMLEAIPEGFVPVATDLVNDWKKEKKFSSTGQQIWAGIEGISRGLTFGISDIVAETISSEEDVQARREVNPGLALTTEIGGAILPAFATGGASLAGSVGREASVVGKVLSNTPAGLAYKLSSKAGSMAGRGLESVGTRLGTRIGDKLPKHFIIDAMKKGIVNATPFAVEGAVEGLLFNAGDNLSDIILNNTDLSIENITAGYEDAAIFGGVAGGLLGFGYGAAKGIGGSAINKFDELASEAVKDISLKDVLKARTKNNILDKTVIQKLDNIDDDLLAGYVLEPNASIVSIEAKTSKDLIDIQQNLKTVTNNIELPKDAQLNLVDDIKTKVIRKSTERKLLNSKLSEPLEALGKSKTIGDILDFSTSLRTQINNLDNVSDKVIKNSLIKTSNLVDKRLEGLFELSAKAPELKASYKKFKDLEVINELARAGTHVASNTSSTPFSEILDIKKLFNVENAMNFGGKVLKNYAGKVSKRGILDHGLRLAADELAIPTLGIQKAIAEEAVKTPTAKRTATKLLLGTLEAPANMKPNWAQKTFAKQGFTIADFFSRGTDNVLKTSDNIVSNLLKGKGNKSTNVIAKADRIAMKSTDIGIAALSAGAMKTLSTNLEGFFNGEVSEQLQASREELNKISGELGAAAIQLQWRAATFLREKMPKQMIGESLFGRNPAVSDADRRQYTKYVNAVNDPKGILKRVADDTYYREDVEVLQNVYPNLFTQLQQQIITKLQQRGNIEEVDYDYKIRIGELFNIPLDVMLQADRVILRNSGQKAQQPNQPNAPQNRVLTPGNRDKPGVAEMFATDSVSRQLQK